MKIIKLILLLPFFATIIALSGVMNIYSDQASEKEDLKKFPAIEVELLNSDHTFNNDDLKGQYTLLSIWSIRCSICIKEIPALESINRTFGGEDFEIVSLSLNSEKDVKDFREKRYSMPWKHAILKDGWKNKIFQKLQFGGTPSYYLVSPEGDILADKTDFKKAGSFISVIERYL